MTPLPILAEGPGYVVVAKPARLACHRSREVHDPVTLADIAREQFGQPVHLVHRLDRGTSGALVIALHADVARAFQATWHHADHHKTYVAQVRGAFRWDDPFVIATRMRDTFATTHVRLLGRQATPRTSLLCAKPATGKRHQIRRHLRDIDHPILGDGVHGDTRHNIVWRREHGLARLALHCMALDLPHAPGGPCHVRCPPPRDLVRVWSAQPCWADACARMPSLQDPPLDLLADLPDDAPTS